MNQHDMFRNARWVSGADATRRSFYFLRGVFSVADVRTAELRVVGLGYFHCTVNGRAVSDDLFLPFYTDYVARPNYPTEELLTGHRLYVPQYDITGLLHDGENEILIHFGGGFYTEQGERGYGAPGAIWSITGEDSGGEFAYGSSSKDQISESFITDYAVHTHEEQDLTRVDLPWQSATEVEDLKTEYLFSDCPADGVRGRLSVSAQGATAAGTVYDCGCNVTGYSVLEISGEAGETVEVTFAEELTEDGGLDPQYGHGQRFRVICDGTTREVRPLFTWFGFRYLAVSGPAEVKRVEVVHTKVEAVSEFESDNPTLNWLNEAFVRTQLENMHGGVPSDCPHLERRGYTGDGQLACHAAMNILDAERFYRKWLEDILDGQDTLSGHVQYTAPYTQAGGGPGGWGCAIVEVPYQMYLHYGDPTLLETCYPRMLRYFDYLEAHSRNGLVVSDKAGEWCLGDWCTAEEIVLPAPFVNNYFYVKSLNRAVEIAGIIGREADIPLLESRIRERKEALMAAYYNPFNGNFLGCVQGANAFAVDIGIGDHRTYPSLVKRYQCLGGYDTGIFGTDVVTRILFEHGDGELACRLLTSESAHSFARMRARGGTTLWEYWPETTRAWEPKDRSHNHPMFGAVTAYLYDYLLGIRVSRKADHTASIRISPVMTETVNRLSGSRVVDGVRISVAYTKEAGSIHLTVTLSEDADVALTRCGEAYPLAAGENHFVF
ncbi:MAG: hypothetical protein E7610_09485 [Ruminococcaceae bacterium]|nr:hypothetical protein [Oscillospiraceae bacterium]